jgi:hypothetical protein
MAMSLPKQLPKRKLEQKSATNSIHTGCAYGIRP